MVDEEERQDIFFEQIVYIWYLVFGLVLFIELQN